MEMIFGYLQSGLSAVLPFVILLGLLIFVHELGHFSVAKFFGVRVEVFSLGFGKKIFKFVRGDTTYCLSLIPLGGYVKMYGDDPTAEVPEEQKRYSFTHKPVSQRIAVVLAGPLMNFFFAIFIFLVIALMGEEVRSPKIGDISNTGSAYTIGFRSGDKILSANGVNIKTWDQFQHQLNISSGQSVRIEVQRENSDQKASITATPNLSPNPNILSIDELIGSIEGVGFLSKASIIGVRHNSPAFKAGLRTGDLITKIQGKPIRYFRELENTLVAFQSQPIEVELERYADTTARDFETLKISLPGQAFASMAVLGFEPSDLYLSKIYPGTPAEKVGLKAGDRITKVSEVVPSQWEDVLNKVKSYQGEGNLIFEVEREDQSFTFDLTPQMTTHMNAQGQEEKRFTVGILSWISTALPELTVMKVDGVGGALARGYHRTIEVTQMTLMSFLKLIQAQISPKNIGGVISIGQAAKETFQMGIVQFLTMMAIISVNLFILNLLPIPVLDGGHLLFYTIEAIKGAPVSMRKMEVAQQMGLAVLMSLMVFALFNDFARVFGFW
jgi:regulator of sigma E protease